MRQKVREGEKEQPEESAFGLHLLASTGLRRVKRGLTDEERRYYIILSSCLVGAFFVCCYLPCALCRLWDWRKRRQMEARFQLHGFTTTNESSTQRGCPPPTIEGASLPSPSTAPLLLPEKPPPSDQNGPELPPSYAAATLPNDKIEELDKRLDQQKELVAAQNARIAEQEEKLAEMSRRLTESEQISARADLT